MVGTMTGSLAGVAHSAFPCIVRACVVPTEGSPTLHRVCARASRADHSVIILSRFKAQGVHVMHEVSGLVL